VSLRYSQAQAQSLGLIPAPPIRRSRKTHTADGHAIDPAFTTYTEREFQAQVMDLARRGGWTCGAKDVDELGGLTYHSVSVMAQSERGWPDLVLIRRRDRRLIFAELKRENGELSPRQAAVMGLLQCLEYEPAAELPSSIAIGIDEPSIQVFLWRPSDLETIREVLR
jgi:hypothetical protein